MRLRTISLSLLLHIGVAVAFSISATWLWKKKEVVIPPPVSVEILTIADKTQTDRKTTKKPTRDKKTQQKKAAKKQAKEESKRPAKAATNKSKTAKTPVLKKPDEPPKKTKKDPVVATKASNKPEAKKIKKQDKKPPPKQEEEFTSVLRNLAEDQKKTEQHKILKAPKNPKKERRDFLSQLDLDKDNKLAGHNVPLGDALTISEVDLLRRQLEQCWSIPIGARDADNLAIDIFMVVNRDRTVHHAKIVDQGRYKRDPFYRAAADSALRAVHHPDCRPLDLPDQKYAMWKEIVITFDPKQMF